MSIRFAPGQAVRVKEHFPPGHLRTPFYCRGKHGTVERVCGEFQNPELLAYGHESAPIVLYRVRFVQAELWDDYDGESIDRVEIELYEHWLEAV